MIERVTIIKTRGGKRISHKNRSFQIKGGAILAKETNGVIRALSDRRDLLRNPEVRIKDDTKITDRISRS